jgi:hypothetical protein
MSSTWPFIGTPRCRDDATPGPQINHPRIAKQRIGVASSRVAALDAAAARDGDPAGQRETEMSLAAEMLSADATQDWPRTEFA